MFGLLLISSWNIEVSTRDIFIHWRLMYILHLEDTHAQDESIRTLGTGLGFWILISISIVSDLELDPDSRFEVIADYMAEYIPHKSWDFIGSWNADALRSGFVSIDFWRSPGFRLDPGLGNLFTQSLLPHLVHKFWQFSRDPGPCYRAV